MPRWKSDVSQESPSWRGPILDNQGGIGLPEQKAGVGDFATDWTYNLLPRSAYYAPQRAVVGCPIIKLWRNQSRSPLQSWIVQPKGNARQRPITGFSKLLSIIDTMPGCH